MHVGDESPLESRAHPVFEAREVLRRNIARDHDLLVVVVQRVEGVEERLLGLLFALQELDVVDEQDVDVAVALVERGSSVVGDRVDEVVRELLGTHVAHLNALIETLGVVTDRVEQVGLAESRVAVDEERVVGLGRRLGDRDRGGVREPIARTDDEVVEDVLRVQS